MTEAIDGADVGLLVIFAEHRLCGPKYEGCYAHWPTPHCRADGTAWPCDVHTIDEHLAALVPSESTSDLLAAVIAAHDLDHRELNGYRAKDSVEPAECRQVEKARALIESRSVSTSREDADFRWRDFLIAHSRDLHGCEHDFGGDVRATSREAGLDADDAGLEAFLNDLYQGGVDTAPEIKAALDRAGYRIIRAARLATPPSTPGAEAE